MSARALAALLAAAGTAHFAAPRLFDSMIPAALPGRARTWTLASGAVELATAAAVAHPRTRRVGGAVAAGLFVAVLPGNVKMAADYHRSGAALPLRLLSLMRLPLQLPLIAWALRVRKATEPE